MYCTYVWFGICTKARPIPFIAFTSASRRFKFNFGIVLCNNVIVYWALCKYSTVQCAMCLLLLCKYSTAQCAMCLLLLPGAPKLILHNSNILPKHPKNRWNSNVLLPLFHISIFSIFKFFDFIILMGVFCNFLELAREKYVQYSTQYTIQCALCSKVGSV